MLQGKTQEVSLEELAIAIGSNVISWEIDLGCVKILGVKDTVSGDFVAVSTCEGRNAIIR